MSAVVAGIKNFLGYSAPAAEHRVEVIRQAFQQRLFEPYEPFLKRAHEDSWDRTTWFDQLQDCISSAPQKKPSEVSLNLSYQFTLAIDPKVPESEKKRALSEKQSENFYYGLIECSPPVVSAHVLRYSDSAIWSDVIQTVMQFRSTISYQTPFFSLMQEVVSNQWAPIEKRDFLNLLFRQLPQNEGNDILCYFLLQAESAVQQQFLAVASPELAKRLRVLKLETEALVKTALNAKELVSIPFQESQRQYFLKLWCENALDSPGSLLVAAALDEKDWKWLEQKKLLPQLPALVMQWMTAVAQHLQSAPKEDEARYWLFFRRASEAIDQTGRPGVPAYFREEQSAWDSIPPQAYEQLARVLIPEALLRHFDAFLSKLQSEILKHFVSKEPQKLIEWVRLLQRRPEDHFDTRASEGISKLMGQISTAGLRDQAIPLLFGSKESPLYKLTVYSSLSEKVQLQILKYLIVPQRQQGLATLVEWIQQLDAPIKPFIKDSFIKNFYSLLNQIDPTIAQELKAACRHINPDLIDLLLPTGIDLNDPSARRALAMKKLKELFLKPSMPHRDRVSVLGSLYSDLSQKEEASKWLPQIFNELPKQAWPLIFLHFGDGIGRSISPDDTEKWIQSIAETFTQMVDNPLLIHEDNDSPITWSMQCICKVTRETKIMAPVIQRFIEIAPPELFIPTMHRLDSSFHEEGFKSLLAEALQKALIDKPSFIVSALKAQYERKRVNSLARELWEAPFLTTDEERATVAKQLIKIFGPQFPRYFNSFGRGPLMIKSLNQVDPTYCKQLFYDVMENLTHTNGFNGLKASILLAFGHAYSEAGFDVPAMLQEDRWKSALQQWFFSPDFTPYSALTSLHFKLLKIFNPDGFDAALFRHIALLFDGSNTSPFYDFNNLLEALEEHGSKEEILHKLREHPDLVKSITESLESNISEAFSIFNGKQSLPFLCKLYPNWERPLIHWMKESIKKSQEKGVSYGEKPDYSSKIFDIYENLATIGQLDAWLSVFRNEAPELREALDTIHGQFLEKQEKTGKKC